VSAGGAATAFARARFLAASGEPTEALAVVDAVLGEDPRHLGALLLKSSLLLELRRDEEGLALCETAVAAWPSSSEALNALARCLQLLGRNQEAVELALRAKALLPEGDNFRETGPVYLTLVLAYRELRRLDEALRLAEEGLRLVGDAVLAHWASVVEEEWAASMKDRC
jgi:tetratricopeptide (TPR) repeat protein